MKVKDTPANREKCLCPGCPSFPAGCSQKKLYCGLGQSRCDIQSKGCICPGCSVYSEYRLQDIYYCTRGEVGQQNLVMRKKKTDEEAAAYQEVVAIKEMAQGGKSAVCSMGSSKKMPFSFADLHFIPAQVSKIPLNAEEAVKTEIVIGPKARKPLQASSPILISGLSFGAVSKKVRLIIAAVAKDLGVVYNSGEGGILPEELSTSAKFLIGQYATGRFGVSDDILKKVAAVEIRFGQGAYPGKGSYLPADKMTSEVAKLRGLKDGQAAYSPAHHADMVTPAQIKQKIDWLRKLTGGVPIGAKIGCGEIEKDVEILVKAGVDFLALDGFGGGTGATDFCVRENVGLPILAALPRAAAIIEKLGVKNKVSLIVGGGLRNSSDFAKCLALGADAVYIGTAALIAINCEQFRICYTGQCPTGITTHNPLFLKQLDKEQGIKRLANFLRRSTEEIANLARIAGKNNIANFDKNDMVSLDKNLAGLANLRYLNGQAIKV